MTPEEYAAKREARYNRLIIAADRAEKESEANRAESARISSFIPFGQPILIGHHSEKRHRRALETINNKARKGYELHQRAEELRSRAEATQNNNAIYSDNPEAVELITDKVTLLEAEQSEMKRINAALRKGADFDTLEMSERHRDNLLSIERLQAYYEPRKKGFPPYALTNLSSQIRTAKKRAEQIEKKQSTADKDEEINGIKIEWRASDNRIRVIFPARVSLETYKKLKAHGYRSTSEAGTFSAYYNNNAAYFVQELRDTATQENL